MKTNISGSPNTNKLTAIYENPKIQLCSINATTPGISTSKIPQERRRVRLNAPFATNNAHTIVPISLGQESGSRSIALMIGPNAASPKACSKPKHINSHAKISDIQNRILIARVLPIQNLTTYIPYIWGENFILYSNKEVVKLNPWKLISQTTRHFL
ncbi:MAG: hypothetical protein KA902_04740 [Arenimonas sp.]|nr:hypothetical protein [Arenimonas sp.]